MCGMFLFRKRISKFLEKFSAPLCVCGEVHLEKLLICWWVRTPVTLSCSLSQDYPYDRHDLHYPHSYVPSSRTNIRLKEKVLHWICHESWNAITELKGTLIKQYIYIYIYIYVCVCVCVCVSVCVCVCVRGNEINKAKYMEKNLNRQKNIYLLLLMIYLIFFANKRFDFKFAIIRKHSLKNYFKYEKKIKW